MTRKCSVRFCDSVGRDVEPKVNIEAGKRLTFHRFPKNRELRAKWCQQIDVKESELRVTSTVCSHHFSNGMFGKKTRTQVHGKRNHKLNKTAFPDQNLSPPSPCPPQLPTLVHQYPEAYFDPESIIVCERRGPEHQTFDLIETAVLCDAPSPRKLRTQPSRRVIIRRRKFQSTARRLKRLQARSNYVKLLMADLIKKKAMEGRAAAAMAKLYESSCGPILRNQLQNSGRQPTDMRYSEEIRSFAVSLHYHSARAYALLR
jgi:THAP domain